MYWVVNDNLNMITTDGTVVFLNDAYELDIIGGNNKNNIWKNMQYHWLKNWMKMLSSESW